MVAAQHSGFLFGQPKRSEQGSVPVAALGSGTVAYYSVGCATARLGWQYDGTGLLTLKRAQGQGCPST